MHIHRKLIIYIYICAYMHKYRTCKNHLKMEEKNSSKSGKSTFKVAIGTEGDLECYEYMSYAIF